MITHVITEPTLDLAYDRPVPRQSAQPGLATRAFVWSYRAMLRASSRRAMRQLPDELLKDVGLSRADVEREASKPFWR